MDFTGHIGSGWRARIRAVSPRRAWMDAAPASFADRGLRLNIANARGWLGLKRVCL
jgi:hypothetical protein